MFSRETIPAKSDPKGNMSEKSVCNPTCDDENISEKEQKEVLIFETELLSSTDSYEDIKVQTDDSAYYVTWTVYIALAVPQGKMVHRTYKQLLLALFRWSE